MRSRDGCRFVVALAVLCAVLVQAPAPASAQSTGGFGYGRIDYSRVYNCGSVIWNSPYVENGASAYIGPYIDPDNAVPVATQTFYVSLVVYGLGNACSGMSFSPTLELPPNVSLDKTQPILCFTAAGQQSGQSCPQWGNVLSSGGAHTYLSTDQTRAQTWPLPQGKGWEFRFPVKSSVAQSGEFDVSAFVEMVDGDFDDVLTPSAPLYVFSNNPVVINPQPSTVAATILPTELGFAPDTPSAYGVYSYSRVYNHLASGLVSAQIGTTPGSYSWTVPLANFDSSMSGGTVAFDWDDGPGGLPALDPGATYYWRMTFQPQVGSAVNGREQLLVLPSATTCNGLPVTVDIGLGQQPTAGDDVILGTPDDDTIVAGKGNDTICAGAGRDTVIPGPGNDWIDAGGGSDTISYANAAGAVAVSLATSAAQATGGDGTDRIRNAENLTGSGFADRLTGDAGNNTLLGLAGADALTGSGGADRLGGQSGDDVVQGGPGDDRLDGGAGKDTASYAQAIAGVTVSLAKTAAQATGGAGKDTITGVENLTGSSFKDVLTGNGKNNALAGGSGGDSLSGAAGSDALNGGSGTDKCDGGSGKDTKKSCEKATGFPRPTVA